MMTSNKVVPLTPAMRKAVTNLCNKAQLHGWTKDCGTGVEALEAEQAYDAAKLKLERMIFSLQKSLRKANAAFRPSKANHNVY
jgi:hypothetical protein